jgi:hypothetical protein
LRRPDRRFTAGRERRRIERLRMCGCPQFRTTVVTESRGSAPPDDLLAPLQNHWRAPERPRGKQLRRHHHQSSSSRLWHVFEIERCSCLIEVKITFQAVDANQEQTVRNSNRWEDCVEFRLCQRVLHAMRRQGIDSAEISAVPDILCCGIVQAHSCTAARRHGRPAGRQRSTYSFSRWTRMCRLCFQSLTGGD